MRRTVSRRQTLALLGTVGLGGCTLSESKETPSFTDGPAEWSGDQPSIPDSAWPMAKRTPGGTASTPASGPTDAPPKKKWRTFVDGSGVRAVVRDGTVFLPSDPEPGELVAVDATDGTDMWQTDREARYNSPPAVSDSTLFAVFDGDGDGTRSGITAYDVSDGTERWHSDVDVDGNLVLTDSSVLATSGSARVVALDQESGRLAWSFTPGDPDYAVAELAVTDKVYLATIGSKTDYPDVGFVRAFDPTAGELSWSFELEIPAQGMAVADETVLATTGETLVALDADTGSELWRQSPDRNSYEGPIAVRDGHVLIGTAETLFAYDIADGRERWTAFLVTARAVGDGVVYTTSFSAAGPGIAAHDLYSGENLWSVSADGATLSLAGGRLYTSTETDQMVAWE